MKFLIIGVTSTTRLNWKPSHGDNFLIFWLYGAYNTNAIYGQEGYKRNNLSVYQRSDYFSAKNFCFQVDLDKVLMSQEISLDFDNHGYQKNLNIKDYLTYFYYQKSCNLKKQVPTW